MQPIIDTIKDTIKGKTYDHISLAIAKHHLKVSPNFTDDDAQISALIKVATDTAANYIENHIALTEIEHVRREYSGCLIDIEQGHFKALQSIEYTDKATGQLVTLSAGVGYRVSAEKVIFLIILDEPINAKNLRVNFTAGFDAATIEPVIAQAILIKLTDLYDIERASYHSGGFQLNQAFVNLLGYHKQQRIY